MSVDGPGPKTTSGPPECGDPLGERKHPTATCIRLKAHKGLHTNGFFEWAGNRIIERAKDA